ncbi:MULTISPECIES: ATP-binding protein [Acinetobacter]|uniref:ATP-binding protein n=1 Tax=Acinetobacter TaxID=469 RepID=UPI002016A289|nr:MULTISPECIES: ATP-binding protein [Acinetobacter]MCM1934659.1 ATP-binding protein [Acinetobacter radioresistens]MCM1952054.1 ATP-binding protein [Acinetobacter radioresistens]
MRKMIKEFFNGVNQKQNVEVEDNILSLEKARERLQKFQTEREENNITEEFTEERDRQNSIFQIVQPIVTLDNDVILSTATRVQLDEGLAKLKFHKTIYEDWNFGSIDKQGRSVILNFYGAPGTGKTLTAEAFAGSLSQPIIKLGIAELESKFMGETSKNIQAVFKAASEANAVLFFDEADTLLGKRLSSVTQGIDNEVNAMRSTLLIELERFNGIAIFATNFAKNYDEAFRSRISHHIHFDLPDIEARKNLWAKMLVDQIPLLESKEQFIESASALSDGFSGREIRTCMRLVLPKALLEAEKNQEEPKVKLEQLREVIDRIKQAKVEVANSESKLSRKEISTAKSLLGVKN